jgi:hypothetical protein
VQEKKENILRYDVGGELLKSSYFPGKMTENHGRFIVVDLIFLCFFSS